MLRQYFTSNGSINRSRSQVVPLSEQCRAIEPSINVEPEFRYTCTLRFNHKGAHIAEDSTGNQLKAWERRHSDKHTERE